MVAVHPLFLYQWGRENTAAKGTAVAATKMMTVESRVFTPRDAVARPNIARGLMIEHPGNEVITRRWSEWSAEGYLAYDEVHRWLEMAILQCVTPTGTDPYTWVHTYDPTLNNLLPSYTLQRRITEGSNNLDQRIAYASLQELTISAAAGDGPDGLVRVSARGFGRPQTDSAITSSLSHPTIEIPPFGASKVYIDNAWGSLGGTQLTGANAVLNWSLTIRTGLVPIWGAEARSDLSFTHVERNGRNAGFDVNMRALLDTSSGQYATEKAAAIAQTLRAVRIQMTGTSSRDLKLDVLGKHAGGDLYEIGEVDGLGVFDINLVSATDAAEAFESTLVNKTNETP